MLSVETAAENGLQAPEARMRDHTMCTTSSTYALFLVFGVGSWLTVNALFTELPLLVVRLPEGYRVASALALAVQLANVGPIAFYGWRRWLLRESGARDSGADEERFAALATYGVLALGAAAMGLLAFCWDITVDVGGARHAVPLLACSFAAALADCTSSLLFWRFVGKFRAVHVSALATGEGLSGVVASFLAGVQGASMPDPIFSARVYFVVLAVLMCTSLAAFHALREAGFARAERCAGASPRSRSALHIMLTKDSTPHFGSDAHLNAGVATSVVADATPRTRARGPWLLALQAWLNVLQNGVSVSCLPLAAKPYGRSTLQLAQTVSLAIDPAAAALGFYIPAGPFALLSINLCITVVYAYVLFLALASVEAPLLSAGGGTLLVLGVGVGRALTAYAKMRANVLLQDVTPHDAEAWLMRSGMAMQGGAFLGTAIVYPLINFTGLFRA